MGWYRLKYRDVDRLTGFLLPREAVCTTLTAHVKHEIAHPLHFNDSPVLVHEASPKDGIDAAIVLYERRQLLPVCDLGADREAMELDELRPLIAKNTDRVFSIMGARRDVCLGERLLPGKPHSIDYFLYRSHTGINPVPPPPEEDLNVRKASKQQARYLFALQEGYEKEEVLLFPERFNRAASLIHFKHQLQIQTVYFIEHRGAPVAKAGTNAKGFGFYQLGGIYTSREYRNRGIGSFLLHRLSRDIVNEGKGITLFVKRENMAAIRMYEKIGLVRYDDFRISYYL